MEAAVVSHAISDVPIGVLLSGGIDSSLIAYYLTKNIKKQINTFSINFEEKSFDESLYAKAVAKKLGTKHHCETFNSQDVLNLFPLISRNLDEPLADPSLFPTYKVCALARKYVKVVLSGDGGDELFGGYPTYQGHILAEQLKKMAPNTVIKYILSILNTFPISFENYPKIEVLKEFLKGLYYPPFKRHIMDVYKKL
ncbi:MAG: asparagine synthase C-terminal domain-containing protein [Actinobacteria bacterium]|nr:asparagine synthase C-terminal domain-containing protein [Actinomycetota bacterium]